MDRGALVPDDVTVRMLLERISESDASGRVYPGRLSAQPGAGGGAG